MIHVIYQWQVLEHKVPALRRAWQRTSAVIHRNVKGARGSLLLQTAGAPGRILTIARWSSYQDWKAFWKNANPQGIEDIRQLGERINVTAYDEFADFTE